MIFKKKICKLVYICKNASPKGAGIKINAILSAKRMVKSLTATVLLIARGPAGKNQEMALTQFSL